MYICSDHSLQNYETRTQAILTHKPAALKQVPRPAVVDPDERVHAFDLILSVSPLKYCGHGSAHQSLAPLRLRQVKRQLRPAVYLGVMVKTAGADKLIIVLESAPHLDSSPAAQRLRHRSIIASTIGTDATG